MAGEETLLRVISPGAAKSWIKADGTPTSLMFDPPVFSTDVESLTTIKQTLSRWPAGSGIGSFSASDARSWEFYAHHHPEHDNPAHANVYCDLNSSQRKKKAKELAAITVIRVPPVSPAGS